MAFFLHLKGGMAGPKPTSCLIGAILALVSSCYAASDWHVIRVGPREYLSIDNVARFYGLPAGVQPSGPQGKTIDLDNGRIQLQVTLESREAIINGVRNWLCFPVIAKEGQYLISRIDLAKTVEPQLRPQMIQNLGKFDTVVIDPGHGGHDKGACSNYGCEKDYTLDIARQLKPLLEAKGLKVVMTRDSDVFIPLEERARIANSTPNCIFVSIHLNATDWNPAAAGFEIYSLTPRGAPSTQDNALALRFFEMQVGSPADAPSLALSMSIYHSVVGHLPEFDRGIKRARFAVLRRTRVPAVLIEGGFLTERNESKLIADSQWRAKYAQSISIGIENYKLLVEKRQRPMLVADYHRQLGRELIARDATQPPASSNTEVIPASNTQHKTTSAQEVTAAQVAQPPADIARTGAPEQQRSEQEQDEPEQPTHSAMPTETPPPAATTTPDGARLAEEPGDSPLTTNVQQTQPPAVAPARRSIAPASPTPSPPPLRNDTFAKRIFRWAPAISHFLP